MSQTKITNETMSAYLEHLRVTDYSGSIGAGLTPSDGREIFYADTYFDSEHGTDSGFIVLDEIRDFDNVPELWLRIANTNTGDDASIRVSRGYLLDLVNAILNDDGFSDGR